MNRKGILISLFVAFLVMVLPSFAKAQEIVLEGPLVGQPAVRKLLLLREGRLSISPMTGMTVLDTFRRNVLLGLKLEYSVFEWFSIGIYGTGFLHGDVLDTKLTSEIESKSRDNIMNLPDADHVRDQIGTVNGLLTLQLSFIPLRGKMGLFKALFLNADFYFFIGGGIGFVKDRGYAEDEYSQDAIKASVNGDYGYLDNLPCQDRAPRDGKADDYNRCLVMQNRIAAVIPTFGAGFDLFVNEWLAINLEYRAIPLKINVSGTDEYGMNANRTLGDPGYYNRSATFPDHKIDEKDRVFTILHTVNLGVSFYFTFGKTKSIMKPRVTD